MSVPHLFRPFTLRGVTFKNRIVVSPMCQYQAVDGVAGAWHFAHHARFALGGVGGAVIEATGVVAEGRITPGCLGLWHDGQIEPLARIAAIYHAEGAPVGIQLAHAGRKASSAAPWDGAGPLAAADPAAWRPVAPSAIAYGPDWPVPHELTAAEVDGLVAAFAAAAGRAVRAGLDFVEIHGAHGYLVHAFLAAVSNTRTDAWGGSPEKRMRFPLAVAEAVRAAVPDDMPVLYRASAVDSAAGGVSLDDTVALARALKACGVDLVDCSSGGILGPSASSVGAPGLGFQVPYAAAVRAGAEIPTMAVGLIVSAAQAEAVLADGSADLVAIGRELLADSNFPYRAARELGLERPFEVLPRPYAFYLARRERQLAAAAAPGA